ncbi:hypothetical protein BSNK01_26410 [Bacillaceae bacterium]
MQPFVLDRKAILEHERTYFLTDLLPIEKYLDEIEFFINKCFVEQGERVVQSGRVIALRATDKNRLASAFKSGIYLGNYHDLANTERFLTKMVKAGHSYEPIRGETILFLYIGVGKPVYDHLVTYGVGRYTRIAGGQRANKPWGYEVPVEARNKELYIKMNVPRIREVVEYISKTEDNPQPEQLQAMRSSLPVGYIMPPFLLEFSEEALIKNVFTQRLFEKGAQGATVDVVNDMWNAVMRLDKEKWETLYDYHGPHILAWKKAMRTLRDKRFTLEDLLAKAEIPFEREGDKLRIPSGVDLYELLMQTVGKLPPSLWEKER